MTESSEQPADCADEKSLIKSSPRSAPKNTIRRFVIAVFFSFILIWFAALSWPGEAPSKIQTLWTATCVGSAGLAFILIALTRRWITAPGFWMMMFAGKFVLSLFITYYFWFEPLEPDLLRIPAAMPGAQDSNLYDYYALETANHGFRNSWDYLNFTWLSFGVTGYIAGIYTIFGVSVAYVSMWNACLSLVGVIMLSATMRQLFGPVPIWRWLAFAMFIPSIAFYDATPGKEPLTHALYYTAFFTLTKLVWRQRLQVTRIIQAIIAITVLAVVRANCALILIAANAWPVIRRVGFAKSALMGVGFLVLVAGTLTAVTGSTKSLLSMFDLAERFTQIQIAVDERNESGDSALKLAVANALTPRTFPHLLIWSPVRSVIWFYLPYPLLIPDTDGITLPPTLIYEDRLKKVLSFHNLCFTLSGWLLIGATPFLLGVFFARRQQYSIGLQALIFNLVSFVVVVGNLQFIMGRRYRTLIEPLVLAIVLAAIHFKLGKNFIAPIYCVMIGGVIAVALIRS
jgi:hypothetical protein